LSVRGSREDKERIITGGGGFPYAGPKLKQKLEWIKMLFGGFSYSGLSWSSFAAETHLISVT
jgi:hypothetical protein